MFSVFTVSNWLSSPNSVLSRCDDALSPFLENDDDTTNPFAGLPDDEVVPPAKNLNDPHNVVQLSSKSDDKRSSLILYDKVNHKDRTLNGSGSPVFKDKTSLRAAENNDEPKMGFNATQLNSENDSNKPTSLLTYSNGLVAKDNLGSNGPHPLTVVHPSSVKQGNVQSSDTISDSTQEMPSRYEAKTDDVDGKAPFRYWCLFCICYPSSI